MIETFKNAFKIPELRAKLVFTFIIIILYRVGSAIPVPFIDSAGMANLFDQMDNTIFGYLNILSGNAFSQATLFALGIQPYITASIIMQLLTVAIPALERLQKSGDDGRKKITQITRYVTVLLGLITGYGYYMYLGSLRFQDGTGILNTVGFSGGERFFVGVVIVACYSAGSALIMWLGEKINESGIGNGISMILFTNIISMLPTTVASSVNAIISRASGSNPAGDVIMETVKWAVIAAVALALVAFVVFMSNAERRLQVQYSKRVVGRKMYGGQSTHLPIKVNMSGVMPIIFASSIVSVPITVISFINANPEHGTALSVVNSLFSPTSILYISLTFILIIAFSYFYISISFNPVEVSNNLKKNGGFIPGIRPGKPTSDYISKILNKIVLIGGLFLAFVAVFPLTVNAVVSIIPALQSLGLGGLAFGGSSLLIVVGVALETTREIEAQMSMRHYKGFLE